MRWQYVLQVLLLVSLANPRTWAGEKLTTGDIKTDGMMVALQEKSKTVNSCRARVKTLLRLEGEQFEILDDLYILVPAKIHVARVLAGEINQTIVSDGSLMWRYDPEEKLVSRVNMGRVFRSTQVEADADQPDLTRPFRTLDWASIRYVKTETVGSTEYRVFDAVPGMTMLHAELPEAPNKVTLWVHPEDGLLRIARYYGAGGKELFSQEFLEVVINPKLDAQIFDFVVPAGVHVMDMTDDVIKILNAAKQTKGKKSEASTESEN
jgi:outer membrane lipoprotein-sorting protein